MTQSSSLFPILSFDDSVDLLNLNLRATNALKRRGISKVGALVELLKSESLMSIKGIGIDTQQEIKAKLNQVVIESVTSTKAKNLQKRTFEKNPEAVTKEETHKDLVQLLVKRQLSLGLLHGNITVSGKKLSEWLLEDDKSNEKHKALSIVIASGVNICDELFCLLSLLSPKHIKMLLLKYGNEEQTLQVIGDTFHITRERARQVLSKVVHRIIAQLGVNTEGYSIQHEWPRGLFRVQSALHIAKDMGLNISFRTWRETITLSGLLGCWPTGINADPVDCLFAICRLLSKKNVMNFEIPENLLLSLEIHRAGNSAKSVRHEYHLAKLSTYERKAIKRHAIFSGAIHAKWLSEEIKLNYEELLDGLLALGYIHVDDEWYMSSTLHPALHTNKNNVFHHMLRKLTQYCGPVSAEDICAALRHVVSRTSYPVPTPNVMTSILHNYGYSCEKSLFYWNGQCDEKLSDGELIIINCIRELGPVVHHSELAQAFLDSQLSFPSLHSTLGRSPIFDRIGNGLYKIRGQTVSQENIARAELVAERVPLNIEIKYEKTGKIAVFITASTLILGTGVLVSEQLPNLSGEWICYLDSQQHYQIQVTNNEVRRLRKALTYINCSVGDRIALVFDSWTRQMIIERAR